MGASTTDSPPTSPETARMTPVQISRSMKVSHQLGAFAAGVACGAVLLATSCIMGLVVRPRHPAVVLLVAGSGVAVDGGRGPPARSTQISARRAVLVWCPYGFSGSFDSAETALFEQVGDHFGLDPLLSRTDGAEYDSASIVEFASAGWPIAMVSAWRDLTHASCTASGTPPLVTKLRAEVNKLATPDLASPFDAQSVFRSARAVASQSTAGWRLRVRWIVVVPLWIGCGLVSWIAWMAYSLGRLFQARLRASRRLCVGCGYPHAAGMATRCPECGEERT